MDLFLIFLIKYIELNLLYILVKIKYFFFLEKKKKKNYLSFLINSFLKIKAFFFNKILIFFFFP